jgi:hypothetical protein
MNVFRKPTTLPNGLPEDQIGDVDTFMSSAVENFTAFMRFNGAPSQCDFESGVDAGGRAVASGRALRCKMVCRCSTRSAVRSASPKAFTTQPSTVPGLSNRTFQPFSDFGVSSKAAFNPEQQADGDPRPSASGRVATLVWRTS